MTVIITILMNNAELSTDLIDLDTNTKFAELAVKPGLKAKPVNIDVQAATSYECFR